MSDPSLSILGETFGEAVVRLSTVRMEGRRLPGLGSLWGTSRGLMFLPFLIPLPIGALASPDDEDRAHRRWSIWPVWRRRSFSERLPAGSRMQWERSGPHNLAEAFLDAPGAVFVPREHILRFHFRSRDWSIVRNVGSTLRLTVLSAPEAWRPAWRQLIASNASWQSVVPR